MSAAAAPPAAPAGAPRPAAARPASASTSAPISDEESIKDDKPALPVRHTGILMVAVMGASIIQFLDQTIANVALPHMQTALGATQDSITWVLTSFIIASAVATPIAGWLADRVGSRNLFLAAVSGFIGASALCGLATGLGEMVAFRIIQGAFAAMIGPLSQAIMLDINRPSKHASAMAIWGMGVMIAPISGPMIGGWLTDSYSWRWVFYINLPIGFATLIVLWWLLPSRPIARRRLDYLGYFLFASGLAALQLMLDRGNTEDWFQSWEVIIEAALAVALLWMFVVHLFTAKNPLFPVGLVKNANYASTMAFTMMMGLVLVALSALMPPMLENLYGYSVYDAGLLLAPRGVGVLVSMMIASRLIARTGPRLLVGTGFTIAAVSLWQMTGWSLEMQWQEFAMVGFIQGLGMGLCFMPMNVMAFATIPGHLRTDGAGLLNLFRSLGGSVGISIITTALARNIQTSHSDLVQHITPYNVPGVDVSSADRLGTLGDSALAMIDGLINRQAAMIAYLDDFKMMAVVLTLFVPLVFLMRNPKGPIAAPPPSE